MGYQKGTLLKYKGVNQTVSGKIVDEIDQQLKKVYKPRMAIKDVVAVVPVSDNYARLRLDKLGLRTIKATGTPSSFGGEINRVKNPSKYLAGIFEAQGRDYSGAKAFTSISKRSAA